MQLQFHLSQIYSQCFLIGYIAFIGHNSRFCYISTSIALFIYQIHARILSKKFCYPHKSTHNSLIDECFS